MSSEKYAFAFIDKEVTKEYIVSSEGQVFSCKRNRFLTPWRGVDGFWSIRLQGKNVAMHFLVAQSFTGTKVAKCYFENGVKGDYRLQNLVFTQAYPPSVEPKIVEDIKILMEERNEEKKASIKCCSGERKEEKLDKRTTYRHGHTIGEHDKG